MAHGTTGNDRGMTSPHQDQPLAAREGVNQGSADSTAESAGLPAPLDQLAGDPSDSTEVEESQTGQPVDMETDEARAMRDDAGPGQQLEAGEG